MKNFMISDFFIQKIVLACFVKKGTGGSGHVDRPSHGLALFCGGEGYLNFGYKKVNISGPSIVYFPKGSSYRIHNINLEDCYAINFDLESNQIFEPFSFKINSLQTYMADFKNAETLWRNPKSQSRLKIKSILYNVICKMQTEYEKILSGKENSHIAPALAYIYDNYLKENVSVSHLADLCGISDVYLRKLFVKEYGLSPNKYIKKLKLEYAETLLTSRYYKSSDICYMSGFNDESYFNREFKKSYGVSPAKYRNV